LALLKRMREEGVVGARHSPPIETQTL
jgi:hypothetical protein